MRARSLAVSSKQQRAAAWTPSSSHSEGGSLDAGGASEDEGGKHKSERVIISSSIWNDDNASGIREPLKGPYTGPMTINVYPAGKDTPPVDGSYTIENVPPGNY
ncbi:hypothetical protein THAOC_00408, partial [Thalassiosira oceanica]